MKNCILLLLLTLFVAGCERRPLIDRDLNNADVVVELDWNRSSIRPSEATLIFYDENGESPRTFYIVGNRGVVKLPVGRYSVLAFNDKIIDFTEFEFRETENYKTISIFLTNVSSNYRSDMAENVNEVLASDSRDIFEVTPAMLEQTKENESQGIDSDNSVAPAHLVMQPVNVIAQTSVTVHIQNMHLIHSGSQKGTFEGFAESVTLWNRQASSIPSKVSVPLSSSQYYIGSTTDGFMSDQFITFGLCTTKAGAKNIYFLFEAVLRDKEQTKYSYRRDISELVKVTVDLGIKIDMVIGTNTSKNDPPIPIPPIVPIDDNAFKPGVDDWEDEEVIKPF